MAASGVTVLHASSDAASTREWLVGAGVSAEGLEALVDFSAADVLALSKDDAKEILGTGTGIRVWNRLHAHQLESSSIAQHGSIDQHVSPEALLAQLQRDMPCPSPAAVEGPSASAASSGDSDHSRGMDLLLSTCAVALGAALWRAMRPRFRPVASPPPTLAPT